MKCVGNNFCVIPKNQWLPKSAAHISSNNSESTNHISLTRTDNCYCRLSILSYVERIFARKSTNKLYFWYGVRL